MPKQEHTEATNLELWGLYNIERSAYLNVLYYGTRASSWAFWNLLLQVFAAVGSLGAVTGFLAAGTDPMWKWISAGVGAASAVCAALPAIMGHADKVNRFEKLHFSYCELFELAKRMAMDIRRSGIITDEQTGTAKILTDLCSRLGQMEDPEFKRELRDSCEIMVRNRFPNGDLWYAGQHEAAEQAGSPTAEKTGAVQAV